jgi:uncharacterized protein YeaO (DUF488 family)
LFYLVQLEAYNRKLRKRNHDAVKLLKQGVQFYESALPSLHNGDITPDELYRSTGWTDEHYENFKRRLQAELARNDFKRKTAVDQKAHKNTEILEALKGSLA